MNRATQPHARIVGLGALTTTGPYQWTVYDPTTNKTIQSGISCGLQPALKWVEETVLNYKQSAKNKQLVVEGEFQLRITHK